MSRSRVLKVAINKWANVKEECLTSSCKMGYELDILSVVASILNYTIVFKHAKDESFGCGDQLKNGTWTGVLGLVKSGEADITGNICSANSNRRASFNVSWPVIYDRNVFLIKAPIPKFIFSIMGPFTSEVWVLLLAIVVIYMSINSLALYFRHYKFITSVYETVKQTFSLTFGMDHSYVNFHWFIYTCFVQYTALMYSTFVMTALLKPDTVYQPFFNLQDVIGKLDTAEYRLISMSPSPRGCSGTIQCQDFNRVLNKRGFDFVLNEDNRILDYVLQSSKNLLYMSTEQLAKVSLDSFKNRSKLWLIYDETSSFGSYSYFYSNSFQFGKKVDNAIISINSAKGRFQNRYSSLWNQAQTTKVIKGKASEHNKITIGLISGLLICYAVGAVISVAVLVLEIIGSRKLY